MEAPGCWQALTNSALNSGVYVLCVRRVGYLGVSDSLSMVCTICCVHTILREGGDRLKMGSPDAYGAGFSRLASLEAPRLLSLALDAVRNCPGGCDSSCYRCLRSFKNKIEHRLLDRHVGAELLGHLQTGDIPGFDAARIGAATGLLMSALAQQADGETYEGNVVVPNVGTVPLVATRANGSKVAVLLAAPLSGEIPLDEGMFEKLSGASGWTVVVVNELLVRHHLPAACQRVRDEVVA